MRRAIPTHQFTHQSNWIMMDIDGCVEMDRSAKYSYIK